MAADRVQSLGGGTGNPFDALAGFYGGMASLPTDDVDQAAKEVSGVAGDQLSPQDRRLQAAAQAIAEQILRAPDPASLTQGSDPNTANQEITSEQAASTTRPEAAPGASATPVAEGSAIPAAGGQEVDPSFNSFVTTSRSKLDEIDGLLAEEGN